MAQGILLETGTNEMELLIFRTGETDFGINVAKVRELIKRQPIISIPQSPEAVAGSFKLREEVLTLIDLRKYLAMPDMEEGRGLIIIIELNNVRCGILVDAVEMIHRLRWENVDSPPQLLVEGGAPVTAVCRIQERVIQVLDFERIVADLLGSSGAETTADPELSTLCASASILVADDSVTIRATLESMLRNMGFARVVLCEDGGRAWEELCASAEPGGQPFDVVLTDVEMPRIDGHHLCVRIKEHAQLNHLPVILYSSLIHPDTLAKGESVGAVAQVSKADRPGLLKALRECLMKRPA